MLTTTPNPTSLIDSLTENVQTLVIDHERLDVENFDQANTPRRWCQKIQKVSVLIPMLNERWTVEKLLHSVLAAPISLELELIVVDDGSTDGSQEIVRQVMESDDRVKLIQHPKNQGKGAAIRTATQYMTGDVAIIQDADLEYDPNEYPKLLRPILEGHADAVFGSRFAGSERRILLFWHSLGNKLLTLVCNMFNDLNLTDMETCYKVVRTDILRELRLQANTFTIEPELTTRLAQWGARIYEVPISYRGRSRQEGKKIRPSDGVKAIWEMIRSRFIDTRFTMHTGMFVLRSLAKARKYNRWLVGQVAPFLGKRVAEAGAGIGNLSQLISDREHLLLVDHDPVYIASLEETFAGRRNVRVANCDLTDPGFEKDWENDQLDTVFCSNVLEHLGPHQEIIHSFHNALSAGGHCILIVPAEPKLYNGLDTSLGHHRRYRASELQQLMENAGFEVVFKKQSCKIGALAWFINGKILRRRRLTPRQMRLFDRCWPWLKCLDRVLPVPGMSLIMVGKKADSAQG